MVGFGASRPFQRARAHTITHTPGIIPPVSTAGFLPRSMLNNKASNTGTPTAKMSPVPAKITAIVLLIVNSHSAISTIVEGYTLLCRTTRSPSTAASGARTPESGTAAAVRCRAGFGGCDIGRDEVAGRRQEVHLADVLPGKLRHLIARPGRPRHLPVGRRELARRLGRLGGHTANDHVPAAVQVLVLLVGHLPHLDLASERDA